MRWIEDVWDATRCKQYHHLALVSCVQFFQHGSCRNHHIESTNTFRFAEQFGQIEEQNKIGGAENNNALVPLWRISKQELYLFILEVAFTVPSNNKPVSYTSWIEDLKRRPVTTNKLAQITIGVSGMRRNGENTAHTLFLYATGLACPFQQSLSTVQIRLELWWSFNYHYIMISWLSIL